MPIKIKKLSQHDLEALRAFTEESFNSDGIVIFSEDEGIETAVSYVKGVIDTKRKYLTNIRGIPKTVKPGFSGDLRFKLSMSCNDFDKLNEQYFSERLPIFHSINDIATEYLPLIEAGKKISDKNFYARLRPELDCDINPWVSLIEFINFGVVLPEHLEIIYGDSRCKYDCILESLRGLTQRKRYRRTTIESLLIKPLSNYGFVLRVKL